MSDGSKKYGNFAESNYRLEKIGVEQMEPQELTNEILLESVLDCTDFIMNEVSNLYNAITEKLPRNNKIFFMNFVEDENSQDNYYGYVYDKTDMKMYEYSFQDNKLPKKRKLSLVEKKIDKLTTKDILELPIVDLL
ncbi:hypothetical protein [Neisseria sp. MVDL19-042950]|uniref:hypothetical protein n=2 Tax=Neisseria TaxID=482 RepID=UPI00265DBA36|nr:hypothetical protein [Neisseria sp. MVDL19-042950]MDO1511032.1 hypothetical protein [Neisseria sp. MVDL19-042950]